MKSFAIYELQKLTGIKMATLRVWEQRYGIVQPGRSAGNTRLYSLVDVRHLLNIAFLNKRGFKISRISALDAGTLTQELAAFQDDQSHWEKGVNELFYLMFALEIERFEEALDRSVHSHGLEATIERLLVPFLVKVDILSYEDSSAEVHFVVTAIRKKLIMGIEKARPAQKWAQKALLFLPKGEHYDLVLLYLTFVLKGKGFQVLYLGTNISVENLHQVVSLKKPQLLVTYYTVPLAPKMEKLVVYISQQLPQADLYVTKSEKVHLRLKGPWKELCFREAAQQLSGQCPTEPYQTQALPG